MTLPVLLFCYMTLSFIVNFLVYTMESKKETKINAQRILIHNFITFTILLFTGYWD